MKIEVLSIWLICLLIVSCEGVPADWSLEENRVNFSAHIEGITTRATNTTWHKSDQVGIYMKDAGKSLIENTLHNNAKYINPSGNSSFTAASESDALYFPSTGNKVDFIAYYPYRKTINDFKYPIDVSSQVNLFNIDFMYSDNSVNFNKNEREVNLSFSHQLCKIVINIIGYSDYNLSEMRVVITNVATKAMFDLNTGVLQPATDYADVELMVNNDGEPIEAILLPEDDLKQKDIWLIFEGNESKAYRYSLGSDKNITSFKKSTLYTYNIALNADEMVQGLQGNINDWLEGPASDVIVEQTDQIPPAIKGSKLAPYSIAEAKEKEEQKGVWINGYIVGSFTGTSVKSFTSDPASAKRTVLALADYQNESSTSEIFPVELPAGKLRDEINILDNPFNLGRKITIKGNIEKYYSAPGLKNPKEFTFSTSKGHVQ